MLTWRIPHKTEDLKVCVRVCVCFNATKITLQAQVSLSRFIKWDTKAAFLMYVYNNCKIKRTRSWSMKNAIWIEIGNGRLAFMQSIRKKITLNFESLKNLRIEAPCQSICCLGLFLSSSSNMWLRLVDFANTNIQVQFWQFLCISSHSQEEVTVKTVSPFIYPLHMDTCMHKTEFWIAY